MVDFLINIRLFSINESPGIGFRQGYRRRDDRKWLKTYNLGVEQM